MLRRGPVRGPSHPCKRRNQGHRRHGFVSSVQLVCMVHEAVLLIIRRSWVRAPPAPPGGLHVSVGTMFTFASDILVCILAWLGLLLCRVRLVFAWWLCSL